MKGEGSRWMVEVRSRYFQAMKEIMNCSFFISAFTTIFRLPTSDFHLLHPYYHYSLKYYAQDRSLWNLEIHDYI
jgi:hypothetical protein